MSGNERSTKQLIAVTDCRDLVRPAAAAQKLPSPDLDTSLVSGHERGDVLQLSLAWAFWLLARSRRCTTCIAAVTMLPN
ncbi:Hypothetical protein ERS075659_04730 [Mycobacteroides abscessus]|nr:Hypothetical protein ERS075659_04730 [Mycobacteroides abscessus]